MTKVLIVGANGFLGKVLTRSCLDEAWSVDLLARSNLSTPVPGIGRVANNLEELSGEKYQYIFNAAAFIPYGKLNEPDKRLDESNINLVADLLEKFPETRMILSSSVSVYGDNTGVLNEKSECVNPNAYGLSKLKGEKIASRHSNYAILRFPSLYGPGMYQGTFIPSIIKDARNKKQITLAGDGSRMQNYLQIRDAARYCIQAAKQTSANAIYLCTSPQSYSNSEIAAIVSKNLGSQIVYSGSDESTSKQFDNSCTWNRLKFELVNIEVGLKELCCEITDTK